MRDPDPVGIGLIGLGRVEWIKIESIGSRSGFSNVNLWIAELSIDFMKQTVHMNNCNTPDAKRWADHKSSQ